MRTAIIALLSMLYLVVERLAEQHGADMGFMVVLPLLLMIGMVLAFFQDLREIGGRK